jgi:hypothetical protein
VDHLALNALQVSGEHDEIDSELVEQIQKLRPIVGGVESSDVDRCCRSAYTRENPAIGCDETTVATRSRATFSKWSMIAEDRSAPDASARRVGRHPRFTPTGVSGRPKDLNSALEGGRGLDPVCLRLAAIFIGGHM